VRLCASLGMVGLGHIAFDGTKLKANASVRQTRDRDGLEKEIERIKEQMRQMIQASAKIDVLEDQKYPDGDGSEVAEELRRKEYRLKNTVSLPGRYSKLIEEAMLGGALYMIIKSLIVTFSKKPFE